MFNHHGRGGDLVPVDLPLHYIWIFRPMSLSIRLWIQLIGSDVAVWSRLQTKSNSALISLAKVLISYQFKPTPRYLYLPTNTKASVLYIGDSHSEIVITFTAFSIYRIALQTGHGVAVSIWHLSYGGGREVVRRQISLTANEFTLLRAERTVCRESFDAINRAAV